jgi:hypothetical protein
MGRPKKKKKKKKKTVPLLKQRSLTMWNVIAWLFSYALQQWTEQKLEKHRVHIDVNNEDR